MRRILILILVVVILAVAAGLIYEHAPRVPQQAAVATSTGTAGTQMTIQSINEDTDTYTINAKYPQFGISSVDQKIQSDLDAALADFRDLPANPPDSAVPKNEFQSDVTNSYVGTDVVSVSLEMSQYTGGAHPMTVIDGINIDPRTGKSLTLDDALSLIGMTLSQVASSTQSQLASKLGADALFEEGIQPTAENYQTFTVSANAVTFVFQQYQAAAYAAGIQYVSFPRVR